MDRDSVARVAALKCRSCRAEYAQDAAYIANAYAPNKDGTVFEWPLCDEHALYGAIVGWRPVPIPGVAKPDTLSAAVCKPYASKEQAK